jgi:dolichol-phosphate mannosyltransferase
MSKISFIIPCYFNEKNIPVTGRALITNEKRFPRGTRFEYIFIDDGSPDGTMAQLLKFHAKYPKKVIVIKLSRNFGSNNATLAGLSVATGDCSCFLAADLQDPPELVPAMFAYWRKGTKLILANRTGRRDGILAGALSHMFHLLVRYIIFEHAPRGGFNLCLFDRQLQKDILKLKEKNFFLPYLLLWLGYDYVTIPYVRRRRLIGHSQWTMGKRLTSFIDAFVSFTYMPLRVISFCGILLSIIAFFYAVAVIYGRITSHIPVQGWTSLVIILLFVSSFQMIALGIIGEYLWRTLDAARSRPSYIIEKIIRSR